MSDREFKVAPRMRVIVDNDFSGDPDDLFQMAHHLLSPSVEIRGIIGSHLRAGDSWDKTGRSAEDAVARAKELLGVMGMEDSVPVYQGAPTALVRPREPLASEAVRTIIAEAMRDDSELPLYVVCGAGLTDLASALMIEPAIARRMTLVWIGGNEYPELALPPPDVEGPEYNLNIDVPAAQYVFGETEIPIWQVPRNVYRQAAVSYAELEESVLPCGELGRFLVAAIAEVPGRFPSPALKLGEVYILGDSPLVLFTALQSSFHPDPASSDYVLHRRLSIRDDGSYGKPVGRGEIRVYTKIDTRLLFGDLFAKLRRFAARG
jgi:inosine-uridine nucleoside N-ribohydrolase